VTLELGGFGEGLTTLRRRSVTCYVRTESLGYGQINAYKLMWKLERKGHIGMFEVYEQMRGNIVCKMDCKKITSEGD
jgi:hypothetical protein